VKKRKRRKKRKKKAKAAVNKTQSHFQNTNQVFFSIVVISL